MPGRAMSAQRGVRSVHAAGSAKLPVNSEVPVSVSPANRLNVIGALAEPGLSVLNWKPTEVIVSVKAVKLCPMGPKA